MNLVDIELVAKKRKRLGQFFSGVRLGRLLASFTKLDDVASIVDPMVGSGDLIVGAMDLGARPSQLAGIEIDLEAAQVARRRIPQASILVGDAFAAKTLERLPTLNFDLVVGNPPFVRYQGNSEVAYGLPDAASVRSNLLQSVPLFGRHTPAARDYFQGLVNSYSGQADLAVPACILSMLLVRPGGQIALVLPQALLSRAYASPLRRAFDDIFELVAVVEDESGSWFADASIRTSLIVARKRSGLSQQMDKVRSALHVRVSERAATHESLVGQLAPESSAPERTVAAALLSGRLGNEYGASGRLLSIQRVTKLSALSQVGGPAATVSQLPSEIQRLCEGDDLPLASLDDLEVKTNQGLRTGANEFFYVSPAAESDSCRVSERFGGGMLKSVSGLIRVAIRNQSETPNFGQVRPQYTSAILDLRAVALPEDIQQSGDATQNAYRPMPDCVADHVRRAAQTLGGKKGQEKLIPQLSAVAPNVKPSRLSKPARFWYQLPDFQERHLPDVYMPRVNAGRPRAFVNPDREALIDANFVTFRCPDSLSPTALAMILNSSWVWALLEIYGTILGGGALKIEAAMLRRLPIPKMTRTQVRRLVALRYDQINECDHIMLGGPKGADQIGALKSAAAERLAARSS